MRPPMPEFRGPSRAPGNMGLNVALFLCAAGILFCFWMMLRESRACAEHGGVMIKTGRVAYYQKIGEIMVPVEETVCSR